MVPSLHYFYEYRFRTYPYLNNKSLNIFQRDLERVFRRQLTRSVADLSTLTGFRLPTSEAATVPTTCHHKHIGFSHVRKPNWAYVRNIGTCFLSLFRDTLQVLNIICLCAFAVHVRVRGRPHIYRHPLDLWLQVQRDLWFQLPRGLWLQVPRDLRLQVTCDFWFQVLWLQVPRGLWLQVPCYLWLQLKRDRGYKCYRTLPLVASATWPLVASATFPLVRYKCIVTFGCKCTVTSGSKYNLTSG